MDEPVSMEGPPRITVDGYGPIPVPQTIEDWMDPKLFPGQNINWYMSRTLYLNQYVPKELINHFYYCERHRQQFKKLLSTASMPDYLNLVINAANYITEPDHQQWLMDVCMNISRPAGEFLITELENHPTPERIALKELRTTIWQLLR